MKYHIYDSKTGIYIETVEQDNQSQNSVEGYLPEQTEFYTVAYIDGEWFSVIRPEYEIIDDQFVMKE